MSRQYYLPPAIPEVAKAYQNDPRTQLALASLAQGSNTGAVAGGSWAVPDGIARMVQGIAGGLATRAQNKRYGAEEAGLIAARQDHIAKLAQGAASAMGPVQTNPALVPQTAPAAPLSGAPVAPATASPPPAMFNPRPSAPMPGPVAAPADGMSPQAQGVASLTDPLAGRGRVTSGFGPRRAPVAGASTYHNGVDMAAPQGTPVQAAGDGVVVRAWNDTGRGGGNSVVIRHSDGTTTGYAHLAGYNVKRGDPVRAGQVIGEVGQTGRATGPHLHFTTRDAKGQRIDPRTLKLGVTAPADSAPVTGSDRDAPPLAAPIPQELPPLPDAPIAPDAPVAEPAQQSQRAALAREMIMGGNRYESTPGMEMLDKGLGEQTQLNSDAAQRRAAIADNVYNRGMEAVTQDRTARLNDALSSRSDVRQFNQADASQARSFAQADKAAEIGFRRDMYRAKFDRQTAVDLANLNNSAQLNAEIMRINATRATAQEKAMQRRQALISTPTGLREVTKMQDVGNAAAETLTVLDRMDELNNAQNTGGIGLNTPVVGTGLRVINSNLREFSSLEEKLRVASSKLLPGAVSDKEGDALKASGPSTSNDNRTNRNRIIMMRAIAQRNAEYSQRYVTALADGTFPEFISQWSKYRVQVPSTSETSFDAWIANGGKAPVSRSPAPRAPLVNPGADGWGKVQVGK